MPLLPDPNAPDADEILRSYLAYYGLGDNDLIAAVTLVWHGGQITGESTIDDIGFAIRDTDAYKRRFAGNIALQAKGQPVYSIPEYIALERAYSQAMQGSGLPAGFYDSPDDFSGFISNNISSAEILDRVRSGFQAVKQADPAVVNQMKQLYGVSEGDLAAYFLDPDKATPVLMRRAQAAQIAGEAERQAGMQLTTGTAELLAAQEISSAEARQGFANIAGAQQLFGALSSQEQAISQEEQIGAVFGTNPAAAQRVRQRAAQRTAEFQGGGGFAAQGSEVTGLSNA
jgi:hypothetical protein